MHRSTKPMALMAALSLAAGHASVQAAQDPPSRDELQQRIKTLEDMVFENTEAIGSRPVINAFDAQDIDLGGFFHNAFTFADTDDGSEAAFNRQTFELLLRADLNKDWSAFFAQAFIRDAPPDIRVDGNGNSSVDFDHDIETPLVIAWANRSFSDGFNLKFGRFITPHGIINRDHFPAVLLDAEQPQFLRPFDNDTIFPNFVNGITAEGRFFTPVGQTRYAVYTGNFVENSEAFVSGARLGQSLWDTGLTVGLNVAEGERRSVTLAGEQLPELRATANNGQDYELYGADMTFQRGPLEIKSEYLTTEEDATADREAFYVQPAVDLTSSWTLFYRYDRLDRGTKFGDEVENMLGINFKPTDNVRLRATATRRDLRSGGGRPSSEADIVQFSGTFSF